jgi:hypothetical protein
VTELDADSTDAGVFLKRTVRQRVLGKFLGVLMFYPTWFAPAPATGTPGGAAASLSLPTPFVDLAGVLSTAVAQRRLVACVPWLCELLAMGRDDQVCAGRGAREGFSVCAGGGCV